MVAGQWQDAAARYDIPNFKTGTVFSRRLKVQRAGDIRFGRVRREIVSLVIFLHMRKTEEQIQAFSIPPDWGAVRAILLAAVPLDPGPVGSLGEADLL
jgi:hypothetical protein